MKTQETIEELIQENETLKLFVQLLLQTVRNTPGGMTNLGKEAISNPKYFPVIAAAMKV